jgi:6-phosphofructokinase
MTEIQEGHVISIQTVKNGGLTFQGKPLEFECVNEEERVYQARAELTEEEIAAGNNVEHVFTIQYPIGEGVITRTSALPKALEKKKENKELTDAEKHTKINSLEYSLGRTAEPTQLADGSRATTTGQKANESNKENKTSQPLQSTKEEVSGKEQGQQKQQESKKSEESTGSQPQKSSTEVKKT